MLFLKCPVRVVSTSWTWEAVRRTSAGPEREVEASVCLCLPWETSSSPSPTGPSTSPTGTSSHSGHFNEPHWGQRSQCPNNRWTKDPEDRGEVGGGRMNPADRIKCIFNGFSVWSGWLDWWINHFVKLINMFQSSGCLFCGAQLLFSNLYFDILALLLVFKLFDFWDVVLSHLLSFDQILSSFTIFAVKTPEILRWKGGSFEKTKTSSSAVDKTFMSECWGVFRQKAKGIFALHLSC